MQGRKFTTHNKKNIEGKSAPGQLRHYIFIKEMKKETRKISAHGMKLEIL